MRNPILSLLQQYLAVHYQGCLVTDFEFLTSGFESDVYTLNLKLPGQAVKPLILRLYPGAGAEQKMNREGAGLAYLQKLGYPVPTMFLSEPNSAVLGIPFTLMDRLDGQNLWPVLAGSTVNQATELLNRFGDLLAHLHQLDWVSFPLTASRYRTDPRSLLEEYFTDCRHQFSRYGVSGFLPIIDWLEENQGRILVRPAVVHLDFHANNILLCTDGRLVVIDWTQVTVADFRTDLSWTLLIMGDFGQTRWANEILRSYTLSVGKPVEDLAYFNVISYIKLLSSTIISLKTNPAELGMRPDTSNSFHQQAPIFRALLKRIQKTTGLSIPEVELALK